MVRRLKADVLSQLPEKRRQRVLVCLEKDALILFSWPCRALILSHVATSTRGALSRLYLTELCRAAHISLFLPWLSPLASGSDERARGHSA